LIFHFQLIKVLPMHPLESTARFLNRLPTVLAVCLTFQTSHAGLSDDTMVFQETGKKRVHVEGCGRLTEDPAERATLARMTLAEAAAKGLALCSRCPGSTTPGRGNPVEEKAGTVATPRPDAGEFGQKRFEEMDRAHPWKEVFFDEGTGDPGVIGWKDGVWQEKWFLDGEIAAVTNEAQGMHLHAGPRWKDEAHHMVLWTKQEFSGDLKIEYDFTRTDMEDIGSVILIYIQATGDGSKKFPEDITKWNEYRAVPEMGKYFRNMNLYHISYATGNPFIEGNGPDYVRARRYMPDGDTLQGTELTPEYAGTGVFKPGVTYRFTILKEAREISMKVQGPDETRVFWFKNDNLPAVTHGRIGLRHMFTRSARYKDFRVSEVARAD
jgi:hypothetical protein